MTTSQDLGSSSQGDSDDQRDLVTLARAASRECGRITTYDMSPRQGQASLNFDASCFESNHHQLARYSRRLFALMDRRANHGYCQVGLKSILGCRRFEQVDDYSMFPWSSGLEVNA